MHNKKFSYGFWIILFLFMISSSFLFYIKQQTDYLHTQISNIKQNIQIENSRIRVLTAEYNYLTSPSRIKLLADKHMNFNNVKISQFVDNPIFNNKLNKNNDADVLIAKSSNIRKKIKWRYKYLPSKYELNSSFAQSNNVTISKAK